MASFRIGQRVRHRDGEEGVFLGYLAKLEALRCDCEVRFDTGWRNAWGDRQPAAVTAYCRSSSLTPLLPPRREEVVSWDECEFTRDGKWKQPVEVRA